MQAVFSSRPTHEITLCKFCYEFSDVTTLIGESSSAFLFYLNISKCTKSLQFTIKGNLLPLEIQLWLNWCSIWEGGPWLIRWIYRHLLTVKYVCVHWLVIACNLPVEIGTGLDLIELSGAICWSVDVR